MLYLRQPLFQKGRIKLFKKFDYVPGFWPELISVVHSFSLERSA